MFTSQLTRGDLFGGFGGDLRRMPALCTFGFLLRYSTHPTPRAWFEVLGNQLLTIVKQSSLIMTYLNQTLWVWLITVITDYNPPLARVGHVFFKFLPLNRHLTVFVSARNKFETTR